MASKKRSKRGEGGKKGERGKIETVRRLKHKGSKHKPLESLLRDAKTVSLDVDDTMIDWTPVAEKVYNEILSEYGEPKVSLSYVRNALKNYSPRKAFRFLGLSEADAEAAAGEYNQRYIKHTQHYQVNRGTVELIHALKTNGKKVTVVSNSPSDFLDPSLSEVTREYNEKYGTKESVASLFHKIRGEYSNSEKNKPSPEGLEDVKSDIHIGDHQYDMQAAHEAFIPSIAVLEGERRSTDFEHLPERMYPDTSSLAHAVNELYNNTKTAPADKAGQHATTLSALNTSRNSKLKENISPGQYATQLWDYAA